MSIRNLASIFEPEAIAVVGATNRPRSVGNVVMRNLLEGGFTGPIMPVNPKYRSVAGVLAYPDVASLPLVPDLAVVCTPTATVAGIVDALGARGTRAAVVISGGFGREPAARDAMLAAARRHGLRIVGSNSLGVLVPRIGLNASLAHIKALPGKVAFVSQSGALCAAVLDWAMPKGIGFSHFVSLGSGADVDFGDVMDYLGRDPATRAILLYIEDIRERRSFMSAGRAAARNKPVLVVKANRIAEDRDIEAAALATGALADPDEIFDAALRRAGMLRVEDIDELFAAFETLGRARPIKGDRLAVLTNGGGTGAMAADALIAGGGRLAHFSPETTARLDGALPDGWSRGNPVDFRVDASGGRYSAALKVLVDDPETDAVLVMHAPNALVPAEEPARAVVEVAREYGGNILTSWVGGAAVAPARRLFAEASLPTYDTPGRAVRAFLHMVNYSRNQAMLMQTPPSAPDDFRPALGTARLIIETALAKGHDTLSEPEAKAVLAAYGIAIVETRIAATPHEAADIAEAEGFPVAVTVQSPDLTRKWDVGGIALNLESRDGVEAAAQGMLARVRQRKPEARITGFTVQRMVSRQNARQLIIGVTTDRVFGPVILFGEGGRAVEIIRDHAIALPPLNAVLARELIGRTRISRLLGAYLDRPAANLDAICGTLTRVSQMIVDLPELVEIDINPLFADDKGVTVVDAHMKVARFTGAESGRLAIRPYPRSLEEPTIFAGQEIMLRPVRPEDEPAHHTLIERLTPEDLRYRFFNYVGRGKLRHDQMARFTQIDYDREMAFIATRCDAEGRPETLGVVRTVTDPDNQRAEFAIVVRSDLKGRGLGRMLMNKMIRYCRAQGTREIAGEVLAENAGMVGLAEKLGFVTRARPGGETVEVVLRLDRD